LEDILMSRDRSFITAVANVTSSTELDSVISLLVLLLFIEFNEIGIDIVVLKVSKAIVFLCHRNGQGSDIVQYFCCEEARVAGEFIISLFVIMRL
jgi:hypothetical protein